MSLFQNLKKIITQMIWSHLFLLFLETGGRIEYINVFSCGHLEMCDYVFSFAIISNKKKIKTQISNFKCFTFAFSKLHIFNFLKLSSFLSVQTLFAISIQMHKMFTLLFSLYSKTYCKVAITLCILSHSQLFKLHLLDSAVF